MILACTCIRLDPGINSRDLRFLRIGFHIFLEFEEVRPDPVVDGGSQEVEGGVRSYVVLARQLVESRYVQCVLLR